MLASIDIGNSQVKIGLFKEDILVKAENVPITGISAFLHKNHVRHLIVSSVSNHYSIITELQQNYPHLLVLKPTTPVPLTIDYATPKTLGIDRIAAAVGALKRFNGPMVIVDAGSCITCDLVDEKSNFRGGTISPGLQLRLQAMHTFTSRLPLLKLSQPKQLVGRSTEEAMLSGVVNGSRHEIAGFVRDYQKKYPKIIVIICGGDANYFDKMIELNIFVLPNLVLEGLNAILIFNDKV
jgi:type III pantothenate kinase